MIFDLTERINRQERCSQPARFAHQRLDLRNAACMMRVVEDDFGGWQLPRARPQNNGFAERMIDAEKMGVAGTARKFIKPSRNAGADNPVRQGVKPERG